MDQATWVILGIVGVMALNQVVMRLGALFSRPAVFWALQAVNLVVASAVIWFGLPGFEHLNRVGGLPMGQLVAWFIGLVFVLRIVQNTQARATWLRARQRELRAGERDRLAAIRSSIVDADEE